MAKPTDVLTVTHLENTDLVVMSRVKGASGAYVLQSTVSAIAVRVFDRKTGLQSGAAVAPDVEDSVFDTLQTGGTWSKDSTGYNLKVTVPGDRFPDGGRTYTVEVEVTPTTGSPFYVVLEADVQALFSV